MNEFINLMESIENAGAFSINGKLTSLPPALKVKGLGTLSLPVTKQQAQELIKLSNQAPFGRGEDTIVDTDVRKVWQVSSDSFEISNPEWLELLQQSVNQIGKDLGLHHCEINFDPYKLLVYEKDSFFIAHRDTEKIPNMFATLVINLPSEHEGGELIVSHGGQSKAYSFADNDGLHPDFVTFYADCYHEVKPITSGYRICLIYNLAIANRKKQPLLSDQSNTSQQVDNFVQQWVKEKHSNPTLTYLLEHSYSEENLCLANLKNGDFSKASVLLNAAEKSGCQAFLCLVTYYRNSYGSTPYHGRYSYDEEVDESDFEECDVSDEEIYAHAFITSKGEKITIKKLHLDEDELLANIPLLDGESKCSISEATGNEGATKELWYHRGAVIIWTMERQLETINKMDIDYKLYFFKKFIQEQDLSVGNHRQQIISLASNIIEQQIQHDTTDISQELIAIGDIELLKKFVHKKIKSRFYSTLINIDNEIFINIAESCGWQHFEHELDEYLTPEYNAIEWLSSLLLIKGLSDKGKTIIKKWLTNLWKPSLEHKLTQEKIENVLYSVALLKLNTIGEELFEFLSLKNPSLTQTYVPAILNVVDKLKGQDYDSLIMTKFIEDACQKLQVGFPSAPVEASDFSRDGSLKCTCKFCAQINQFLPNPEQSDARISKTLKRNLIHIGDEIQKSGVDLEIIISRSPPKFEGLCKKNQKSYERKLSLFNGVQTMIKALQRS